MSNSLRASWVSLMTCIVCEVAIAVSGTSNVYHCPGNIITNEISARQAQQQGCRVQASANVTVLPESPQPVAALKPASAPASAPAKQVVPESSVAVSPPPS
jgi:predicted RNA-binding Zn-ribbon protein involved in translation (DUF1610 family)